MTQHLDLDALQAAAELHRLAGAQLANVAFNWAQQPGYTLTSDDCEMLRNLYKQWDASTNVLPVFIDRLRKAEAARNGYQLVPIEPTPVMISEAWRALIGNADYAKIRNAWGQMLAAAPDSAPTDSAENDKP